MLRGKVQSNGNRLHNHCNHHGHIIIEIGKNTMDINGYFLRKKLQKTDFLAHFIKRKRTRIPAPRRTSCRLFCCVAFPSYTNRMAALPPRHSITGRFIHNDKKEPRVMRSHIARGLGYFFLRENQLRIFFRHFFHMERSQGQ